MPTPDPAPQVHLLAPQDIDATILPRDRTALDPTALAELEASVLLNGLRQPIEVFALAPAPATGPRHGLISGLRRLTVMRRIGAPAIPAFLRAPTDATAAMADMIAENEMRADITPWEKGRIIVAAVEAGLADTLDAAVARLYPTLDRHRRARLRMMAGVADQLGDHLLTDPRMLTQNQITRLAAALRHGMGTVVETALTQAADRSPDAQWRLLLPIIEEAEADIATPPPGPAYRKGRPRRVISPRKDLHIRRERTPEGWTLRFTDPDATGPLMEDIMDAVERDFGR